MPSAPCHCRPLVCAVSRMKPKALHMLGKHSTTGLYSQSFIMSYFETGSLLIAQTNLELKSENLGRPWTHDPPASVSQVPGNYKTSRLTSANLIIDDFLLFLDPPTPSFLLVPVFLIQTLFLDHFGSKPHNVRFIVIQVSALKNSRIAFSQ